MIFVGIIAGCTILIAMGFGYMAYRTWKDGL